MFRQIIACAQALAATLMLSGSLQAAPIAFQVDSAGSSVQISNCQNSLGIPSGCIASATLAPSLLGNPIINVEPNTPATTFQFLQITAAEWDRVLPDSFDITATLSFLAPTAAAFGGVGQGMQFLTNVSLRFLDGAITFDPIAPQQIAGVGLVTVSFLNAPSTLFGQGPGQNPTSAIISASISVVPLPAGVLLLGTALLGLFGLSRRRTLAAA
ncbi:MAG: hypothetical protein R3D90_05270 [Paracoccaceae bacterium]